MTDYRLLFDANYLREFHLGGKDCTVTIEKVEGAELVGEGGRKAKKPLLHLKGVPPGAPTKLAISKTVAKVLARAFGNDTSSWAGKTIVLYPTMTTMGGEEVPCIRAKLPKETK